MKLDLSKYALVYAKDDTIYGSTTGIPADNDTVLIGSVTELANYKLVYVNADFTAILGSTTGIPTENDVAIYTAPQETPESGDANDEEPTEPPVEEDNSEENGPTGEIEDIVEEEEE